MKAAATTERLLVVKYLPGLLFQNGDCLVLIINTTKVCVLSDSTNQAVWNWCCCVSEANGIPAAVAVIGIENTRAIVKKVA